MGTSPHIRIDLTSAVPVYRQIVDQIRTYAVEGALRSGDVLPSVRRLAIDLGIHFNTVAEAYRTLSEEGWIDVSQGRATRIRNPNIPGPPEAAEVNDFRRRLRYLIAEMRARGLSPKHISRELLALSEGLKR